MIKLRNYSIKGISILLLIGILSPAALAQAGRGSLFMSGFVRDQNGSPVSGARVVAVLEERLDVKREAITDEHGKWTILSLRKGKWILSAFAAETMSELTDVFLNVNKRDIELSLIRTTPQLLIEAKTAIYAEDYKEAIQILTWFISYFPDSRELPSALFWTSFSHERLSRSERDRREAINHKNKALPYLERLISDFSESQWKDDAEILRIHIAMRLFQMGRPEHAAIIQEGLSIQDRSAMDIKLAALEALLYMDQTRAVHILSGIALNDPDPGVRKKAVMLLGQTGTKEAVTLLEQVAKEDPESTVRNTARFWLER